MLEHNWIKILLTPFSLLYGLITILRNKLYDSGVLAAKKTAVFSISVGNLTVGGTGKTPMVEHLAKKLLSKNNIAILSRGYGRETKGLVFADASSTATDIGDEPFQYYNKFAKKIIVVVCGNRVKGAEAIHQNFPGKKPAFTRRQHSSTGASDRTCNFC